MARALYFVGNPATRQVYTLVAFTPEEALRVIALGAQFLVAYDEKKPSHVAMRPCDTADANGDLTATAASAANWPNGWTPDPLEFDKAGMPRRVVTNKL